jgi:hypothetical protein
MSVSPRICDGGTHPTCALLDAENMPNKYSYEYRSLDLNAALFTG